MKNTFESALHKEKLLERFNAIYTLQEKFKFWEIELKEKYIFYLIGTGYKKDYSNIQQREFLIELQDFEIIPQEDEVEEYNKKILDEYIRYIEFGMKGGKVISFDLLKDKFYNGIAQAINKNGFINKEIDDWKQFVSESSKVDKSQLAYDNRGEFFKHEFDSFYLNGEAHDYSKYIHEYQNLIALNNGKASAEYMLFLEKEKAHFNDSNIKEDKEEFEVLKQKIAALEKQLSGDEKRVIPKGAQLLLFHLLGFGDTVHQLSIEKKQKGQLIGALLHSGAENAEKSHRTYGTKNSEVETAKNYEILSEFLYSIGMKELANDCNSKFKSLANLKNN